MVVRAFEHPVLAVDTFPVATRGGERQYIRLAVADWVNVVPVTPDGEVVLVRQFRHGIGASTIEVPGGVVEAGEEPEVAAIRELEEETGFVASRLESLGWVWPNPAIQDNRVHLFVAWDAREVGPPALDEGEDIAVELVAMDHIPAMLLAGEIRHALVVVSLERALTRWRPQ